MANEADRILALEGPPPAEDVNAADEVPCSTWFCARNHLRPMSVEEIAAGPAVGRASHAADDHQRQGPRRRVRLPGQGRGGRKFMLKFDVAGHPGMANAGEMIGNRIFHAAGYNVPGALSIDLDAADLKVGPTATYLRLSRAEAPAHRRHVRATLSKVARLPDGRVRAVVVPWIAGNILGGFDMLGVRDRRSERPHPPSAPPVGARELGPVRLAVGPGSELDRHDRQLRRGRGPALRPPLLLRLRLRVRFRDQLRARRAAGRRVSGRGRPERSPRCSRSGSTGGRFRTSADEWQRLTAEHPALGYFPAETFDPDTFRTNRKLPVSHAADRSRRLLGRQARHRVLRTAQIADAGRDRATARRPTRATSSTGLRVPARHHRSALPARRRRRREPPACAGRRPRLLRGPRRLPAVTRRRQKSATRSRRSDGPAAAIASSSRRRPDPPRACRSAAPSQAAAIASFRSVARFVGACRARGRSRQGRPARVHLRWRGRHRPLRRRRPRAGRMTVRGRNRVRHRGGDRSGRRGRETRAPLPLAIVPLIPRCGETAGRPGAHGAFDRPAGGARGPGRAASGDERRLLADREYHGLPRIPPRRRLGRALAHRPTTVWSASAPELQYSTSFLPTGGARFFYRRLPGPGSEIMARFRTAGRRRCSVRLACAAPTGSGLSLLAHLESTSTTACSPALARTPTRSWQPRARDARATDSRAWAPSCSGPGACPAADCPTRTAVSTARDYRATDVTGGPSVAESLRPSRRYLRGARPPDPCVDESQLPGFHRGLRIARAGGGSGPRPAQPGARRKRLQLCRGRAPSRRGWRAIPAATPTYAAEIGRRHRRATTALFLVRARATMVERLGAAPIPFEELVDPVGHD